MSASKWKVGDRAVYLKQKHSTSPGPRAKEVAPAPGGDTYSYVVEKYWVVVAVLSKEQQLRLQTRRKKQHVVSCDDPLLRKPKWWEHLLLFSRFPKLGSLPSETSDPQL